MRLRSSLFATVALSALTGASAVHAAQPQFWTIEGARELLNGELKGASVDSEGRLQLAPEVRTLHDTESPYVWCLERDDHGAVYAGTGNDGRIYRLDGDHATVFFDVAELEIHALAWGPDGRLYAASSPDGKVYAIDRSGKAETFYDPEDRYIWALAFDRSGNLLIATGAEGRLHRVAPDGKAEVLFTSADTHLTALALTPSGQIVAGSSPSAIVYRIETTGKVSVLHDSSFREVKALATGGDGSIYAAMIDGRDRDDPRSMMMSAPAASTAPAPSGAPAGEVTVTESFTLIVPSTPTPSSSPRPDGRQPPPRGALLKILPEGEVETLWSSPEEMPQSLVRTDDGLVLGTGGKGQIYRVRDDRTWTMLATLSAEHVTGLLPDRKGALWVGTSNPGKLHSLSGASGTEGEFLSKVKDTETVSVWGRLRWTASNDPGASVQLRTRSGNTSAPDSTWSEWSAPYERAEGELIKDPPARFVQIKAELKGSRNKTPVLNAMTLAYLQRNLRPQIISILVHPPGEVFQRPISLNAESEVLGMEDSIPASDARPANPRLMTPSATTYSRKMQQKGMQTFSWRAEDPNSDTLTYDVHYRRANDTRYRLLRKNASESVVAWDTTAVPNGRYLIRVTASDQPSNPASLTLTADKESTPFDVDNTPPTVTVTLARKSPPVVQARIQDDSSLVRKAEYSIDGGRWQEIHPVDTISDAPLETYDLSSPDLATGGPHTVVFRGTDLLGNVATGRIEVP